jgi:hypothetical protein
MFVSCCWQKKERKKTRNSRFFSSFVYISFFFAAGAESMVLHFLEDSNRSMICIPWSDENMLRCACLLCVPEAYVYKTLTRV